jgi:NADH-quinone oxidoreductase subunit E
MAAGQPFAFTAENRAAADKIIAKYPPGRQQSAVMPLLDLAQRQNGGWLSREALAHVAEVLDMALIRVYEVATFYTMYNLSPVGRHVVQVCTTTPCWLRGSDAIMKACEHAADGDTFSVQEVECLGACVNAPVVQINDDFYEDLDEASLKKVLDALKRGETPKPGPQVDRQTSAPEGGATTLRSE